MALYAIYVHTNTFTLALTDDNIESISPTIDYDTDKATTNCRQHKEVPGIPFRERYNRFAQRFRLSEPARNLCHRVIRLARLAIGGLNLSWGSKILQITSPISMGNN